jgi:opacity protein-like surface antigen
MRNPIPLVIIILLVINFQLFAGFKEGYILTSGGDTLRGWLSYDDKIANPSSCMFKLNEDDPPTQYLPGEIRGYRYKDNGRYFASMTVPLDQENKTLFLEWLIKGKANILCYAPNAIEIRYFIILDNDSIYELKNTLQREVKEGKVYEFEKKEYVGALTYYLGDCPSLYHDIRTAAFSSKSFVNVAKKYHELTCDSTDCIIYADNSRKLRFSLGILMNTYLPQVTLNNERPESLSTSRLYGFGIAFQLSNLSFISRRLQVSSGFSYSKNIYSYDPEGLYFADKGQVFEFKSFKIPLHLDFDILNRKVTPFVGAGITANVRYDFVENNQLLMNYITRYFDYDLGIAPFQLGYTVSLGLKWSFLENYSVKAECQYETGNGFFGTYITDMSGISQVIFQCSLLYHLSGPE